MKQCKKIGPWLISIVFTLALVVPSIAVGQSKKESGKWMAGDFHNHTTFTDGSWPMNDLIGPTTITPSAVEDTSSLYKQGTAPTGFRYNLDFFTNSEHGGTSTYDGFGNPFSTYSPSPAIGDSGKMWRWQTLIRASDIPGYVGVDYLAAYDWILGLRANYPDKLVMTGMEWNTPGHEHTSTGIFAANALPIAEFEYRFDRSDTDGTLTTNTATTMGWAGKKQNSAYTGSADYAAVLGLGPLHNKTIDALQWMRDNYPMTAYAIPAHVERAGCGVFNSTTGKWDNGASGAYTTSNTGYSIAAFRDMNDNAPNVAFGFEGLPGHDRGTNRGEFGSGACGGGTYGGAGYYIAKVGGLWDNLLADGRRFFNFDSSDFHDNELPDGVDFWPGEYEKTVVKVIDANGDGIYTQEDVINGLRSGNSFAVHGDLINELDFRVFHGNSVKNQSGKNSATMGETLSVGNGEKITVQIRFKSPVSNNCEAGVNASSGFNCAAHPPVVHHIQLIQGRINPTKAATFLADGMTPNPAYNAIDNTVADIVGIFDASSWTIDKDGYTTMTYTVHHVRNNMFFRIRGTNLGYNVVKKDITNTKVVYGTDQEGSPLLNTPGVNTQDAPWEDLWFYSNPIYVYLNK